MKQQHQIEDRTQTITNPRLITEKNFTLNNIQSSSNKNKDISQNIFYSPHHVQIKRQQNIHQMKTDMKYSCIKTRSQPNNFLSSQVQQRQILPNLNANIQKINFSYQKGSNKRNIQYEDSETQSEDDFNSYYYEKMGKFSDIGLNKTQILLHIQQLIQKKQETSSQINQQSSLDLASKIFPIKSQLSAQVLINTKQIQINLNQTRQIKKLKKLTPIRSLKKYILNIFGYSQGARNYNQVNLSFFNLYPNQSPQVVYPIQNQENLELILSEYMKLKKDLFIRFQHSGKLMKKVQRNGSKNFQVQFDSDGQLNDDQIQEQMLQDGQNQLNQDVTCIIKTIKQNKTQKSRYRGKGMVQCAFCKKTNKDTSSIKKCGPFYGPFSKGRVVVKKFCHLLCAIWCSKVYLTQQLQLKEVAQSISSSKNKKCCFCLQKGAGLNCKSCSNRMHYECALGRCNFIWPKYMLQCQTCANVQTQKIQIENDNQQEQSSMLNSRQNSTNNQLSNKDHQDNSSSKNQKMQIEGLTPQDNRIYTNKNSQIPEQNIKFEDTSANNNLSFSDFHIVNSDPAQKFSQIVNSKTISIPIKPNRQIQKVSKQQLFLDTQSRISINSSDVQVLQQKCKKGNPNLSIFEVKLQQDEISNKKWSNRSSKKGKRSNK